MYELKNAEQKGHVDVFFQRHISIISGAILGAFFCIFNIIVALKTGLSIEADQIIALMGFFILKAIGSHSKVQNNIIQATASGGIMCMFAIDSAVAANVLYGKAPISIWTILGFGLAASTIGIILAYFFQNFFIKEAKLSYPLGTATSETINTLSDVSSKHSKYMLIGSIIAVIICVPIHILHLVPENFPQNLFGSFPSFLGLALSPLLFGFGYMIGWRASSTLMAGALFSYAVWIFDEKAALDIAYNSHANNMWILSIGISIMIMSALMNLWNVKFIFKRLISEVGSLFRYRGFGENGEIGYLNILLFAAVLSVGGIFYNMHPSFKMIFVVLIILMPLTVIAVLFGCQVSGETGLAPVTPLGIIAFLLVALFIKDFKIIMYSGAMICAAGLAAINMINSFKAGDILGTPKEDLVKTQLIGSIVGVVVGSISIYLIGNIYSFGSESLPTPVSITWGAVTDALSKGNIPTQINLLVSGVGAILAIVLTKLKISSICFGVGVIIPPALSLTIFSGGVFRLIIEKRHKRKVERLEEELNKGQSVMSGLIIGEGLVVLVSFIKILFS